MATAMLENRIQQVKDSIESREFITALKLIEELESGYPPSAPSAPFAQVLVLKALWCASTGDVVALSLCADAVEKAYTDPSVLPDVLNTSRTICQCFEQNQLAIAFYENAGAEVSSNLDLMMGLFQCYVRESLFVKQLMISLKMYKLSGDDKFLMWAVFSIQLQVISQLVEKHATIHNLDEPEDLLMYVSVTPQQDKYDHAREILSLLGTALLIGEVGRLHIKGGMLLARLCDYAAAMEILRQKLETCPDDWESFPNYLCQLLEHNSQWCGVTTDSRIHPPLILACKLSQLSENEFMQNQFGTELLEALTLKLANLPMEVRGLDEAADEYFNRLGVDAKVSLQISRKSEEVQLINYFRGRNASPRALLQKVVESFLVRIDERAGFIHDGVSAYRGTSIALKTNRFIILAADGKLVTNNNSEGLEFEADKVWGFNDMCAGILGSWKILSNTISMLKKHFKGNGIRRPSISKLTDIFKEKLSTCKVESGITLGAFDLKDGQFVPCISYADKYTKIDINESFFCSGTGRKHANRILSEKVHMDMSLEEAVGLVERALVYASVCDSCTGGYATIYVIEAGKPVRAMTRERICTTLWLRHRSSLPEHHFKKSDQRREGHGRF